MRIKKYENASSPIERQPYIRNYQWRIMPQTERKYKDHYLDSDVFSGDRVWTDEQGNIVTADTPNAAADFAVQYRNPRFELDYPEITIEGNGKGYFTGESFADRYARELAAPIAKNADVDKTFKEQAQQQHEQSKEKHDADVKAADARANQLTPGVGTFVVAPVAATLAPILGYEAIAAAPALYSWLTGTTAGQGLVASTLGGEAVEGLSRLAGYNGFGDMMTKNAGWGNEFGWSFANPGYYLSPSRAAVGTASRVAADALGNVKIANPLMESLKSTMGDYSRNMFGIDPGMTKVAVNAARKKAINTAARASFYFPQKNAAAKASQLWRNQEYNNFLNTINGDNYYELVQSTAERPKVYYPDKEYFISHTTPWAEFTETGFIPSWAKTEAQIAEIGVDPAYFVNAKNKLYEFPHETFGDLKATGATLGKTKKVYDTPVRDLGEAHLKYGKLASGHWGEVPTMGDYPNTYRQGWGLTERPLLKTLAYPEGIYDYNPIYENIFRGPQTIVTGDELTDALLHSNYNIYERTPNGVQRTVFLGEPEMQLSHKDLNGSNLKGVSEPKYTYNPKTGEFDISFPRGLRRKWATEARDDVVQYFDSDDYYNHLIQSGATPEQAWNISAIRAVNAENAQPIVFRNLGNHTYGDSQNIEGQALIRLNQKLNNRAQLISPESIKHTVYHELGGHGSSLNIGAGNVTIPERQSSILTEMYKHNEALRPQLRPFYQAVKDGNFELAKQIAPEDVFKTSSGEIDFKEIQDFIKYMEDNQEYSARGIASNIAEHQGLKGGWNIEQLRKYFTDKSVDNLLKNVWTIIPAGYGISKFSQSNRKGGKLIPRKFQFGGFNRPIARQDNTRVVQQTPRMKVQTPRKVTRPSYNFGNQSDRVRYAMQRLTSEGKFTKNQAAALLGVYLDENGLNPKTVQGKEKAGRGVKGTRGTNEYGAGPWSWTGPLKKQLLKNMGYSEDTLFENLPFNVQVDGLIASTKSGPLKSYFDTLRKYNGESASLLATIMTGGVGYLRNWNNPTLEELRSAANNMQNAYIRTNGKSDYTLNAVQRRLDNMNTILTTY